MTVGAVDRVERDEARAQVVFDAATTQRLAVAEAAAQALEGFDERAWEELDPVVSKHLAEHAARLRDFLERVRKLPRVAEDEGEVLALRRVERRLEIALEEIVSREDGDEEAGEGGRRSAAGSGVFYGDFTDHRLTPEQLAEARERRRQRLEQQRVRLSVGSRTKRIAACLVVGVAVVAASAVLVFMTESGDRRTVAEAEVPFQAEAHLDDLRMFLPVVSTVMSGGTINIVVSRDWLLEPAAERAQRADEARVYLANRAVSRMILQWDNGQVVAWGSKDEPVRFVERE